MASKLYPPQVEGILPAFYKSYDDDGEVTGAALTIPFGLNRAVALNEIYKLEIRLKTVSTNTQIFMGACDTWDQTELTAYFTIDAATAANINEGQFYKAQLAFIYRDKTTEEQTIGYWSTVGTIKCVSKPKVTIANFNDKEVNGFVQEFVGEYEQDTTYGDSTEKVETYEFNIWDTENNLVLSSGIKLHNSADDISSSGSTDIFKTNHEIKEGKMYYIQYTVTTLNNLTFSSPLYKIMQTESVNIEYPLELHCSNNFTDGYIELQLRGTLMPVYDPVTQETEMQEQMYTGTFLITRGSDVDDYFEWDEIIRFNMDSGYPSDYIFRDFTVEQGITYKYRIQQYNIHKLYSNPIYLTDNLGREITVTADFEDMFIYDGKRQLKVRFNPKVTSFKNTIPEQKIETIGSKYPFIFRNGHVNYKEFPISGLISYTMDDAMLFLNSDELEEAKILEPTYVRLASGHQEVVVTASDMTFYHTDNIHENLRKAKIDGASPIVYSIRREWKPGEEKVYDDRNDFGEIVGIKQRIVRQNKDLTSENIMGERYFKLKVLDWLTNGEVKLFRSPTEGNYLVRILNVSLAPNDTVGRMLHTFTGTCYEIDELNYDNLIRYGIVKENVVSLTEMHWGAINVNDLLASYNDTVGESGPWNARYLLDEKGNKQSNGKGDYLRQTYETWDEFYTLPLNSSMVIGFSCSDFAPGDIIEIVFSGTDPNEYIVIGNTGSYNYDYDDRIITSIAVKPNPDYNNYLDFSRVINYKYEGLQNRKFDTISNITTKTQIAKQYIGPYENVMEPYKLYTVNEYGEKQPLTEPDDSRTGIFASIIKQVDRHPNIRLGEETVKFDILQVEILHAQRRLLIPVFLLGQIDPDSNASPKAYYYAEAEEYQPGVIYYTLNGDGIYERAILPKDEEGNEYFMDGIQHYFKKEIGYSLTPFGNGYVNYNSIYVDTDKHLDTLSEKVLRKMIEDSKIYINTYDIEDINFILDDDLPTPTGAYSIYQVFVPVLENGEFIEWGPTDYFFDTYTHSWNRSYEPYFSINEVESIETDFDNLENTNKIYLDDIEEVTYTNLGKINKLEIGNGAMVEITFQLQIVDYSIEEENSVVKLYKDLYLTTKYGKDGKGGYFNRIKDYYDKLTSDEYNDLDAQLIQIKKDIVQLAKDVSPNLLDEDGNIDIKYQGDKDSGEPILDSTGSNYAQIIYDVTQVLNDIAKSTPLKRQMVLLQNQLFKELLLGWTNEDDYEYNIVPQNSTFNEETNYYIYDEENNQYQLVSITEFKAGVTYYTRGELNFYPGLLSDELKPVYFGTTIPIPASNDWYHLGYNVNDLYTSNIKLGTLLSNGTLWPTRWWPSNYATTTTDGYKAAYNYSVELEFKKNDDGTNSDEVTDEVQELLNKDNTLNILLENYDFRYADTINSILYRLSDNSDENYRPVFTDVISSNTLELKQYVGTDTNIPGSWDWKDVTRSNDAVTKMPIRYIPITGNMLELKINKYYLNNNIYILVPTDAELSDDVQYFFKQSDYRKYLQDSGEYHSLYKYLKTGMYNIGVVQDILEDNPDKTLQEILNILQDINIQLLYMLAHVPAIADETDENIIQNQLGYYQYKPELDYANTEEASIEILDQLQANNHGTSINVFENLILTEYEKIGRDETLLTEITDQIYYIYIDNKYLGTNIVKNDAGQNCVQYQGQKYIILKDISQSEDAEIYQYFLIDNNKYYIYKHVMYFYDKTQPLDSNGKYPQQLIYDSTQYNRSNHNENGIIDITTNVMKIVIEKCKTIFRNQSTYLNHEFWHQKVGAFVEAKDDLSIAYNNVLDIVVPYYIYVQNQSIIKKYLESILHSNGKQTIQDYLDEMNGIIDGIKKNISYWTTVKQQSAILLNSDPNNEDLQKLHTTAVYNIKMYGLELEENEDTLNTFLNSDEYLHRYLKVQQYLIQINEYVDEYKRQYDAITTPYNKAINLYEYLRNFIYDLLAHSANNGTKETRYTEKIADITEYMNEYQDYINPIDPTTEKRMYQYKDINEILKPYIKDNKITINLGYFAILALLNEIAHYNGNIDQPHLQVYIDTIAQQKKYRLQILEHYTQLQNEINNIADIYSGRSTFIKSLNSIIDYYAEQISIDQTELIKQIKAMTQILKKLKDLEATLPDETDFSALKETLVQFLLSVQKYYIIDVERRYNV